MSALPRPDLPPGAHRDLVAELHALHHRSGWPSLRSLARRTGVSHTTVSKTFSHPSLPPWGTVELVAEALDGDVPRIHELWLAASSAPSPTSARSGVAGRRVELDAVGRHLASGSGLLLVTGEAGIGKTTLVQAAAEASETVAVLAPCLPLATEVSLLPFIDALTTVREIDDGRWLTEALAGVPPFVRQSLARVLPDLPGATTPATDDFARHHLFAAVGSVLTRLAAVRPVALVLEDLHWADASTLDLVEHLVGRPVPVPVVGTWRTEDDATPAASSAWLARMERSRGARRLRLAPLTPDETGEQLRALGVDAERADRIHRRSQGQPLFTEQLAAHSDETEGLPEVLADLLDHRLEGLDDDAWAVLRALGVSERPLSATHLAAVSGLRTTDLDVQLRTLGRRRLTRPSTGDTVQLQHPLLADAIRRRLVPGEAPRVHRSLAEVLADEPAASAAEVAHHWRCAGDPAQELRWRVGGARDSARAYDWAQEADHWLRVLDLWPTGHDRVGEPPVTRLEVYVAAMDALKESFQWDRAADMSERAVEVLGEVDDVGRGELLRRAAEYRGEREGIGVGMEVIDEALLVLGTREPTAGLVHALSFKRSQLMEFGRYAEAGLLAHESAAIASSLGDPLLHRQMLVRLAWHEGVDGVPETTFHLLDQAAHLVRAGSDPIGDIVSAIVATDVLLLHGRPAPEVAEAARPALAVAAACGIDIEACLVLSANVAQAMLRAGSVDEAESAIGAPGDRPPDPDLWAIDCIQAVVDCRRGRLDEALTRVDVAVHVGPADEIDLETWCMGADVHFWEGTGHDVLARLLHDLGVLADSAPVLVVLPGLVSAARGAAEEATADRPGHERLLAAARDLVGRVSSRVEAGRSTTHVRAHLDTAAAELARAAAQDQVGTWAVAARHWDALGRPHDAAYCRWRGAQAALRAGQGTIAARLLTRAAASAREHVPLRDAITDTSAGARRTDGDGAGAHG